MLGDKVFVRGEGRKSQNTDIPLPCSTNILVFGVMTPLSTGEVQEMNVNKQVEDVQWAQEKQMHQCMTGTLER